MNLNSDAVLVALDDIARTSSINDKQAKLEIYLGDDLFRRVVVAALDPFVTYGMAQLPERSGSGVKQFDEPTWTLLCDMSRRNITGNEAKIRVQIELDRLSEASSQLLRRIVTKDLRAGFGATLVNKVRPNTVPTFDCMLCKPYELKRVGVFPVIVEPKLDGVRVLAFVDLATRSVKFLSRTGKPFTTFEHLVEPTLLAFENFLKSEPSQYIVAQWRGQAVLDGEMISGSFNKTVSEVRRKNEAATDAVFHVFDCMPLYHFEIANKANNFLPLINRKGWLQRMLTLDGPVRRTPVKLCHSHEEIQTTYQGFREQGLEGAIVKIPNSPYVAKRSFNWLKMKAEDSIDAPIIGAVEGTGKYEGMLGALVVDVEGVAVNIGSGLSDEQRASFWAAYQKDARRTTNGGPGELLGRMIEIEYHEKTPDGSLRHPRFVRFRSDAFSAEKQ